METQMDEHAIPSTEEVPLFDDIDYSPWIIKMKWYLKSKGTRFLDTVVVGSVPSKKQSKFASQKEEKNNNVVTFNTIYNGLSRSVKERIRQCNFTKDIWLKLEKAYRDKIQDT
jgi:hypothetical protein